MLSSILAAVYLIIAFIFHIELLHNSFPNKMAACYAVAVSCFAVLCIVNLHLSRVLKQYWLNSMPYQEMMVVLYPDYLRFEQDQLVVDLRMKQG